MLRKSFISAAATMAAAMAAPCVASADATGDAVESMMGNRKFRKTVGVLMGRYSVFFDWAGAAEVFYSAGFDGESNTDEFGIVTIAKQGGVVPQQVLGNYTPQFTIANAPKIDVLIIPGSYPGDLGADAAVVAWTKQQLAGGAIVLTVCTGALVAAKMGILDGLKATTSHGALKTLAKLAPTAQIQKNVLFVDNGNIVTAAGSTSGIDAALHIVSRLMGSKQADDERQYLEYKWSPPGAAVKA